MLSFIVVAALNGRGQAAGEALPLALRRLREILIHLNRTVLQIFFDFFVLMKTVNNECKGA